MSNTLADVEAFLQATPPFDRLEDELRSRAAAAFDSADLHSGAVLVEPGARNDLLYLIRRGAVEAHDRDGQLTGRYGEGESFALQSLLTGKPAQSRCVLIEDGIVWAMPRAVFEELRSRNEHFDAFYARPLEDRLSSVLPADSPSGQSLLMTPLGELARGDPIGVSPDATIVEAARRMAEYGISSLLVLDGEHLLGIVTDRDLRNRVLAEGRDPAEPVAGVMTPDPFTVDATRPVLEGILAMAARGIHHLPLTRNGLPAGMITTRELVGLQTQHPLLLAARIQRQSSVDELVEVCSQVPRLFDLVIASGMRLEQVPKVLTLVTDTVTRRLIQLAEQQLGPPPARYAWLAFGSQAREEQSLKTDQDNGLVHADDAPPEAARYFAALARFVCDGLDACGYPYCPGDVMATTDDWRQPLSGWIGHFSDWSNLPDPEAVLRVSIFFDLRAVCGDAGLVTRLGEALAACGGPRGKGVLTAQLARDAAGHNVPLGFFRRFVLESRGEHRDTLDIKLNGLMPLTDLVRVRALQAGIAVPGTEARIARLLELERLSRQDADRLRGAYRLLAGLRVRLHAAQARRGEPLHNHLDPSTISHAERVALRDAFQVVREAQKGLAADFSV